MYFNIPVVVEISSDPNEPVYCSHNHFRLFLTQPFKGVLQDGEIRGLGHQYQIGGALTPSTPTNQMMEGATVLQ